MVGTNITQLIRRSWIACITAAGSNLGRTSMVPLLSRVGRNNAAPAWLSGVQASRRSGFGHSHSAIMIESVASPTRWILARLLGLPVVPPEYPRRITPEGPTLGA